MQAITLSLPVRQVQDSALKLIYRDEFTICFTGQVKAIWHREVSSRQNRETHAFATYHFHMSLGGAKR